MKTIWNWVLKVLTKQKCRGCGEWFPEEDIYAVDNGALEAWIDNYCEKCKS